MVVKQKINLELLQNTLSTIDVDLTAQLFMKNDVCEREVSNYVVPRQYSPIHSILLYTNFSRVQRSAASSTRAQPSSTACSVRNNAASLGNTQWLVFPHSILATASRWRAHRKGEIFDLIKFIYKLFVFLIYCANFR